MIKSLSVSGGLLNFKRIFKIVLTPYLSTGCTVQSDTTQAREIDMPMSSKLKAGEVASQASVNVETLRYYEREGLLPEPARSDSGYRLYSDETVKTVRFIKRSQDLGFSLSEIKELLALRHNPDHSAGEVKALTEHKITVIEGKIQALQAMRETLLSLAKSCPGSADTVAHCPIIHCLDESTSP